MEFEDESKLKPKSSSYHLANIAASQILGKLARSDVITLLLAHYLVARRFHHAVWKLEGQQARIILRLAESLLLVGQ